MAAATIPQRRPEPLSPASKVIMGLYDITLRAGSGALAGWAFSIINPIGGAIFGVSSAIAGALVSLIPVEESARHIQTVVSYIFGLAAGILATTLVGFPLTAISAVVLSIAMAPAAIIMVCSAEFVAQCGRASTTVI